MTPASPTRPEVAPLPERGVRVLLDGLPGGPWSSVVEACEGEVITLAPPRLAGRLVRLPLRRAFVVAYSHREVPCEVDAELVDGPVGDAVAPYLARLTSETRRMQRRGAVRVPIHVIALASIGDDHDGAPLGAVTENISAGGALLRVAQPIGAGEVVRVRLQCGGEAGTLEFEGRVVRCDPTTAEQRPWHVALAFLDMPPADEDRLVRFIFQRQRAVRARDSGLA